MNAILPERRPCPVKQQSKAGEVQLPYGESKVDGRMRHISEVPSGLACECKCPACNADLVARKGSQQAHNFAHRSNKSCIRAYETAIHKLAKQVIAEAGKVGLPEVKAVVGDEERLLFPGRVSELGSVTLEKWLPGMRPDIVAQSGERKLLIEVAVTHFCDERKRELIRERAISAIEIDLQTLPRDAGKATIEAAILSMAGREWLYNKRRDDAEAEMAAEQQRKAAKELARWEAAIRTTAAGVLKAWLARPARADVEAALKTAASWGRDVRDGQLERHLHLDVGGEAAFLAGKRWLTLLVGRFIAQGRWCMTRYTVVMVLDALREAGQIKNGLDGFIGTDVADIVRQTDPTFLSPYEAVEAALTQLCRRGVVSKRKGSWSTDYTVAYAAEQAIEHAREARARIGEVRKALGELIVASGIDIDVDAWLTTKHGNGDETPAAMVTNSQRCANSVVDRLGRLRGMVQGEGALEEDLMGLPLERFRERRRVVLKAEREREEAAARRRAEEARKAAEEQVSRQAARQRELSIAEAFECLGDTEARRFVAEPLSCLGGQALTEVDGVSPDQVGQIMRALAAERRRLNAVWESQRLEADCRSRLRKEVGKLMTPERARLWLHTGQPMLQGRHPWDVAVDEHGLERCRAILRNAGKRR